MDTIEEVFAFNLRALRGGRTQQEVAEASGLPYRTYVNLEQGRVLPQSQALASLCKYYGVSQTRFYFDPDLTRPTSPEQALEVMAEFIKEHSADTPELKRLLAAAKQLKQDDLESVISLAVFHAFKKR